MMSSEDLADLVKYHIEDAHIQVSDLVTGKQAHHGITVVSDVFVGKSLLDQHRMVMDILKEKLKREIHAIKIKTLTYASARQKGLLASNPVGE